MKKSSVIIIFLNLLVASRWVRSVDALASAIYVFGDSLIDTGNNLRLNTTVKPTYPYGVDFPGGSSGRCSNGKIFIDYLAEGLGLPYVAPYLGLSDAERAKTVTGVNYASSACGILDETNSLEGECLPFSKQLHYFEKTAKTDLPKQFASAKALSDHLSKAIFVVSTGTNDYNNYLQPSSSTREQYTPEEFSQLLIDHLSQGLERLYNLGARKMLVLEIGPLGCFPFVIDTVNAKSCYELLNDLVTMFNNKLPALLNQMKSTLDGLIMVQGQYYAKMLHMFQNPSEYDSKETFNWFSDFLLKMRSSLSIVFLILLLQSFFAKSDPLAPSLYIFGDSLLDNGNHNHQVTEAKANYEPYGVDFPGGATGRFTNGKTYADILGEELGLPFAPPYFGLSDDEKAKTSTGVNYASAGSGFLDETRSQMGPCFSFNQQLDFFQKTVEVDLPKQFTSPKALSHYLSKTIFMVSLGGNDYLSNYLQPNFYNSSKLYTLEAFTELLHEKLSQGLQRLYTLGARKVLVSGIGPIGCLPAARSRNNVTTIVDELNGLVSIYNSKLPKLLKKVKSTLDGMILVRGDTFASMLEMCQNPTEHGKGYPVSGTFWGMELGIGCNVEWDLDFDFEVIDCVGAGCGFGFSVDITLDGVSICLPIIFIVEILFCALARAVSGALNFSQFFALPVMKMGYGMVGIMLCHASVFKKEAHSRLISLKVDSSFDCVATLTKLKKSAAWHARQIGIELLPSRLSSKALAN
ncbi:uncharacterized protein LOC143849452 [Tasmannia lanceolata]|uniref:uncharacterized protein LOC143849452 n=1 Tax=Tasmannia lanceolata TaxID=3420 RepID=UPI0040634144